MTTTNRKQKPIPSSANLLTKDVYTSVDSWHTRVRGAVSTPHGIVSIDHYTDSHTTCYLQLSTVLHGVEYVRMMRPGRWFRNSYLVTLARRFAEEMAAQHNPRQAIYAHIETAIAETIRRQRAGTIGPRNDIEHAGWVHAFAEEAQAAATDGRLAGTRLHLINTAAAAIMALQHITVEDKPCPHANPYAPVTIADGPTAAATPHTAKTVTATANATAANDPAISGTTPGAPNPAHTNANAAEDPPPTS